ncbi:MAG: ankyrin repeat domain-containing protein, partial [Thiogranum sp.]|nr:ankyrin repeat domain-containing protein [Thiogranum sp.]
SEFEINVDKKNREGNTALMLAASAGHRAVVERLLKKGADPSLRNRNREQAVTLATAAGHPDIAQLLQEHDSSGFWLLKGL